MTHATAIVFAGLFGACIGSFLNVVIHRLPRGESLSKEASHCPRCGARIRWFDNVPVLGWILLRGRCRACRGAISIRYPIVEALTAALFVLVALRHDPTSHLAVAIAKALVLAAFVAVAYIDHDERTIPTRIVGPGAVVGLAVAFLVEGWAPAAFLPSLEKRHLAGLLRAVLGAATGAGTVFAIRLVGGRIARKEVMGMGDVRLMAMVGAFTGPLESILVLFLGSLSGAVLGGPLVLLRTRRLVPIPVALGPAEPVAATDGAAASPSAARGGRVSLPEPAPVPLRVRAGASRFSRRPPRVELALPAASLVEPGVERTIRFAFPAGSVWRDGPEPVVVDARVRATRRVEPPRAGALGMQRYDVVSSESDAAEESEDVVDTYAMYRKAIPFGVFLAVGAAVVVLYGDAVSRFAFETWPRLITGGRAR